MNVGRSELRMDREPLLTQIRLSSDDTVRLVEIVAQLKCDPAWQRLSDEYVDAVVRIRPSDFGRASGREIDAAINGASWERITITSLFPPEMTDENPLRQRSRVANFLLALGWGLDNPVETFDRLVWPLIFPPLSQDAPRERQVLEGALRLASMAINGPSAEAEAERRGRDHVGAEFGWYLLLEKMRRRLGQKAEDFDFLHKEKARAFDAVVERIYQAARRRPRALRMSFPQDDLGRSAAREAAAWQAPATLDKRWGHLDGFDVFSRALDGALDIAPRAIAEDFLEDLRSAERRIAKEVPYSEDVLRVRFSEEGRSAEDELLERLDAQVLIGRFLQAYPEHQDGINYLWGDLLGQTDDAIARQLGVSRMTVYRKKQAAITALRQWRDASG